MPVTGLQQYFLYDDGAAKNIGIVAGGELGWNPNIQTRDGIAAQSTDVGGSMAAAGTVNILVQDKSFFTTAGNLLRASATNPTINPLIYEGGALPGAIDDGSDWRHTGCKVTSVTLNCAVDGPLTADIAWIGTGASEGSGTPPAASSNLTYEWYAGAVTIDGVALLTQDISLTVNTGVTPYYSLDTKASQKRFPDGLTVGNQTVTLNANVITFPGSSRLSNWILADAPSHDIAAVLTFVGSDTFTATLARLICTGIGIPFNAGDGTVIYPLTFKTKTNDIGALTLA